MAQSDQVVQNATFPAVRADINDNLAALFSQSSGASAPTVTVAFQPWVDTSVSPPLWKIRNAANTGWITIGTLDTNFAAGGVTPISSGGTGQTTAAAAINALLPSQAGNSGKYLGTNGSVASWLTAAGGLSLQTFTSSGTFTPTANKVSFLVLATGGGGGGGGSGATTRAGNGGGGGGTAIRLYTSAEMGASATVTVGGGGTGGASSDGNGGNGGNSSFAPAGTGLTITGNGGGGGSGALSTSGGTGGGTSNSLINIVGEFGCSKSYTKRRTSIPTSADNVGGGAGGMSFWGYGSGSGSFGAVQAGATNGSAGVVLVLEW